MKRVTVFASGSGTNFQSLIDAASAGVLTCTFSGLLASADGIGALGRAEKAGISTAVVRRDAFPDRESFVQAMLFQLQSWQTDVIVLAGYLKKLPDEVVRAYRGRILNIHPALLPKFGGKGFYGIHVHEAVLAAGESVSGCTVHLVDEIFDHGDVIVQTSVPVLPGDTPETLQKRVLAQEHLLFPSTLQVFLNRGPQTARTSS